MGTHPIFESDFDCQQKFGLKKLSRHGSRSYQDCQEGLSPYHREVLHDVALGLPHQQACYRGDRYHPNQASPQSNRRFHHSLDEAHPCRPSPRYLHQIQEEERERRDNYVPEVSALEDEQLLAVDPNVSAMIKSMDFENKDALMEALKSDSA